MKDTVQVAEGLLGCCLLRQTPSALLAGLIVETEAYLGLSDPSCHSFKGRKTKRTASMYLPGGHSYVYFTYGMHYCFNIVTGGVTRPEAVLIRALEPLKGLSQMKARRKKNSPLELCSGPGKLCQAFGIEKSLNAVNLCCKGPVCIAKSLLVSLKGKVETDRRIGLPLHEDSSYWPLRFYIKDNPFVSLKREQRK